MVYSVKTYILPCVAGLGQTSLGGGGGLTLGSLLATSTAVSSAPAVSIGLGGVDFSTSSESKSNASSGANAQYVLLTILHLFVYLMEML